MADFKELIQTIQGAVDDFLKDIPETQSAIYDKILSLTKKLDTKGDNITANTSNIKLLADISSQLTDIILNKNYLSKLRAYTAAFDKISTLQNDYFESVLDNFKPTTFLKALKKQSVNAVVKKLTESLSSTVSDDIGDVLSRGILSGSSYADLQKQLNNLITGTSDTDGLLQKYTGQIATDAINQYSGQYTQTISAYLGFEWYRYSGSNIQTSRPFCLACTQRKYFHISEIPEIIKGNFPEFKEFDGVINSKTKLPNGMIPGTDSTNFMVNRGGYNCGHQWRPVSIGLVPKDIQDNVFATSEYQSWKRNHPN